MEYDVATRNDLGFVQPIPTTTSEFLYSLQDEQPQPVLKRPSPSKLQYWEYEQ